MHKHLPSPIRRVERYARFLYLLGLYSKEDMRSLEERVREYGRTRGRQ